MLTSKIDVGVFSGTFKARMLKLGIHMVNELYCGIENQTPCSYSSLYCSYFIIYLSNFLCVCILAVEILCYSFLCNSFICYFLYIAVHY